MERNSNGNTILESNHFESDSLVRRKPKRILVAKPIGGFNPKIITIRKPNSAPVTAIKTGNVSQPGKKKKKGLFKKSLKSLGKGIGKAGKKIGKIAKGLATYPLLLPLSPVMGSMLKKAGYKPPRNIEARAQLFYNKIVAKNKFDEIEFSEYEGDERDNLAPAIIPAIISFVKDIIQKKKSGKKLDPVIDAGASVAIAVEKRLESEVRKSDPIFEPGTNMKGKEPDTELGENAPTGINFKNPVVIIGVITALIGLFLLIRKYA